MPSKSASKTSGPNALIRFGLAALDFRDCLCRAVQRTQGDTPQRYAALAGADLAVLMKAESAAVAEAQAAGELAAIRPLVYRVRRAAELLQAAAVRADVNSEQWAEAFGRFNVAFGRFSPVAKGWMPKALKKPEGAPGRVAKPKATGEQNKVLLVAALCAHHGFGTETPNHEPATQDQLARLMSCNRSTVSRTMRQVFGPGGARAYRARCVNGDVWKLLNANDRE